MHGYPSKSETDRTIIQSLEIQIEFSAEFQPWKLFLLSYRKLISRHLIRMEFAD